MYANGHFVRSDINNNRLCKLMNEEFKNYLFNASVEFQLICLTETWSKSYNEDRICFIDYKSVV